MSLFRNNKSTTLLELFVGIALVGVITIGIGAIVSFSHYQVFNADRRTRLQSEASFALEHMTRNISRAIGSRNNDPVTVVNGGINIRIDSNGDGALTGADIQIRYALNNINQLVFFPNAANAANEVVAGHVSAFVFRCRANDATMPFNRIEVTVNTRWAPLAAITPDNPEVTMRTRVDMPSVSTN